MTYASLMTKLGTWCRSKSWRSEQHILTACSRAARVAVLEGSPEELAYIRSLSSVDTQYAVDELNAGAAGVPYAEPRDTRLLWLAILAAMVVLCVSGLTAAAVVYPAAGVAVAQFGVAVTLVAVCLYLRSRAPRVARATWVLPPK